MLPALSSNTNLALRAGSLAKAPWFEIWLFKTRLRFRNPKATAKVPATIYAEPPDMRPFVNTESKRDYWCAADGSPTSAHIFSNRWSFAPRRWFAKSAAMLDFHLTAVAVKAGDKGEFPDLYQPEMGAGWLKQRYRDRIELFSQFNFTKLDSGDVEVEIDDGPKDSKKLVGSGERKALAEPTTEDARLLVEAINLNGHIAYRIAPTANQLDFVVPFTSSDALVFSYVLTSTEILAEQLRQPILQQASRMANEMMQTVVLEYPDNTPRLV